MSLLTIEDLRLSIGGTAVLHGLDLSVDEGEIVAITGESGSGKSMTALSVMQLLPDGSQASGKILHRGIDVMRASEREMCAIRGRDMGMVFQEPMTALNPLRTIGSQVAETIAVHTARIGGRFLGKVLPFRR